MWIADIPAMTNPIPIAANIATVSPSINMPIMGTIAEPSPREIGYTKERSSVEYARESVVK